MEQKSLSLINVDPRLYVLDLSSYIFRAYYAIKSLSTSQGLPTNAIYGVTKMILSLIKERSPHYLVIAVDSKPPTFRHKLYPEYKANRPSPPEDLLVQLPYIHELIRLLSIPRLEYDGYEADDVIASIVRKSLKSKRTVVIVSGDKDLMQLVSDKVIVYDSMKEIFYTPEEVKKKFGVTPEKIRDYLALLGDSSDNILGVEGVGPKTASRLIAQFGSIEEILDNIDKVSPEKLKKAILTAKERLLLNKELVSLYDSLDIPEIETFNYSIPDKERLVEYLEKLEFYSLMKEMGFVDTKKKIELLGSREIYLTVTQTEELTTIENEIKREGIVSLDIETDSLLPIEANIVGIAVSIRTGSGYYIPISHLEYDKNFSLEKIRGFLEVVKKQCPQIIGHNFKFDFEVLKANNIDFPFVNFDTMLASYLLDPERHQHKLEQLAMEFLNYKMISYDEVTKRDRGKQLNFSQVDIRSATRYAVEDAEITLRLYPILKEKLEKEGIIHLLNELEIPLSYVLADMELTGVQVDTETLIRLSQEIEKKLQELQIKAFKLAGTHFNLNSTKQLREILFEKLGLPLIKKTKTGGSTDIEVLEELAALHPLPETILEYRQLAKLKNTYLDTLPGLISKKTGRIHTSYNQAVVATGRLSSSNPNLQNIPVRSEIGKMIRSAFVAPENYFLLSADYSQIELRILAHLSKDPILIDSFLKLEDIHERTAREIFNVPSQLPMTEELRRRAKAINFGIIYGKTDYGLAKELKIPKREAGEFIRSYFEKYRGVKEFFDKLIEEVRKNEYVMTIMGRRRYLKGINSKNANIRLMAERMARNTPIQGSAADILKLAMISIYNKLKQDKLNARMIMTVHDELVFEVPEEELEELKRLVKVEMEGVYKLEVPLIVDVGVGKNWAEAHP